MAPYTKLPSKAKVKPTPFKANISDSKLKQMLDLIKLSPIGIDTYENNDTSRTWGMNRKWLSEAKDRWAAGFDWRASEARINSFPNYTVDITDDDGTKYTMHFIALFSDKEDAIPIGFFHGWPGSILEFLDMLDVIKGKYTPETLPYHIIVPSLPGYTFSSGPPVSKDCSSVEMGRVCQKLMHQLGFSDGYVAQGGDLGSFISRQAAQQDTSCKAFHVNMFMMKPPKNMNELPLEEIEMKYAPKGQRWLDYGSAYGREHGTRNGTIGLVLSASPVAMLAWIGEKFLEWTDQDPPVDKILESVSLYWLTDTFPRCIYPYRSVSLIIKSSDCRLTSHRSTARTPGRFKQSSSRRGPITRPSQWACLGSHTSLSRRPSAGRLPWAILSGINDTRPEATLQPWRSQPSCLTMSRIS